MNLVVRAATPADAEAIAALYAPYVTDTTITFEIDPPDAAAMARRIATVTQAYPWLVGERDGVVIGYAYASRYRERAAYRWVCETAIYLAQEATGKRLGGPLYTALLDTLEDYGYVAAIGVIALPNRPSVRLHEKLDFERIGTQPRVGFKNGVWCDVGLWQLDLAPRRRTPAEPGPPAQPR
jgi:phosphinothricin acetyltransferase